MTLLAIFLLLLLAYSAFSRALERTYFTAPILFTLAGMLLGYAPPPDADPHRSMTFFLTIAEIGLVFTLFTDASRIDLRVLAGIRNLPTRLLSTGMLLTIALGLIFALLVFPGMPLWQAGALAAILAPTDAGLGLVIVNSPKVPLRIRQALNVEAGLNDGLSVPFLLFFIALGGHEAESGGAALLRFMVEQLGYGTLVGLGVGLVGGLLLGLAHRRRWMTGAFGRMGVVTLPLLCVVGSEHVGASMFIAAFVAGLASQVGYRAIGKHSVELAEDWGQFLNLAVFFLFGVLAEKALPEFGVSHIIYAVLSLTLVRILPVWVALRGTGLSRATTTFMGWFGPRGLASIVLGLIYLEETTRGARTISLAVTATVFLSIFAHGLSAKPGIALYARKIESLNDQAPERQEGAA